MPDLAQGGVGWSAVRARLEGLENALTTDARRPLAPGGVVVRIEQEVALAWEVLKQSLLALALSVAHCHGALSGVASLAGSSLRRRRCNATARSVAEGKLAGVGVRSTRKTNLDGRVRIRNALSSGRTNAVNASVIAKRASAVRAENALTRPVADHAAVFVGAARLAHVGDALTGGDVALTALAAGDLRNGTQTSRLVASKARVAVHVGANRRGRSRTEKYRKRISEW